jgi:hypothetical protein
MRASIIIITVLLAGLTTACEKELTPAQKQEKLTSSVGLDASLSAGFLVSALRSCGSIGIGSVDQCAENKGSLVAEQAAVTIAKLGIEHRNSYFKACRKNFSDDYCRQLLLRAVNIELRSPSNNGS